MNIIQFVRENRLKPADAIVLKKKFMGMVDHYTIYLGNDNRGAPKFVANFVKGVEVIPDYEINEQLVKYVPERIERFQGDELQRRQALQRASSRIGEKAYGFFSNNCEHFKNWVHSGRQLSEQVDTGGNILAVSGAAMTLNGVSNENDTTRNWGLVFLALGIILKGLSEIEQKK